MRKLRVTLVEDQEELRRILSGFLRSAGFELIGAFEDGKQAHAGMDRELTDILISDFNMPNMTGGELLVALRAEGFKKPAICWSSNFHRPEIVDAGFDESFDKIDYKELISALKLRAA